jgi:hypothetical protein
MIGNNLFVPSYQRAYSWDTETDPNDLGKQVNAFLSDLEAQSWITPFFVPTGLLAPMKLTMRSHTKESLNRAARFPGKVLHRLLQALSTIPISM